MKSLDPNYLPAKEREVYPLVLAMRSREFAAFTQMRRQAVR
jgi:hypothetical protein